MARALGLFAPVKLRLGSGRALQEIRTSSRRRFRIAGESVNLDTVAGRKHDRLPQRGLAAQFRQQRSHGSLFDGKTLAQGNSRRPVIETDAENIHLANIPPKAYMAGRVTRARAKAPTQYCATRWECSTLRVQRNSTAA